MKQMKDHDTQYAQNILTYFPALDDPESSEHIIGNILERMAVAHASYGPTMLALAPARMDRLDRSFFLQLEQAEAELGIHVDEVVRSQRMAYYAIRAGNQHVLLHPFYGL